MLENIEQDFDAVNLGSVERMEDGTVKNLLKQKEMAEEVELDTSIAIDVAQQEAAAAVSDHVEKFEHMLRPMGEAEVLQPPDANGGE